MQLFDHCIYIHRGTLTRMATYSHKILVVEDDEVNLMIAEHVLSKAGFEVVGVQNGVEAVERVRDELFDLIFMDIEMPIMDGLEATPKIRELANGHSVPIIALTAHSIPEKINQFEQAGMNDHIIKPIDLHKVQVIAGKYL